MKLPPLLVGELLLLLLLLDCNEGAPGTRSIVERGELPN